MRGRVVTQTALIRLDTLRARVTRASAQSPAIMLTMCAAAQVDFAFVTAADAIAPLDGGSITVQCGVKARPDDKSALLLDVNCEYNAEEGEAARYKAEWTAETLDSDALRAFLGSCVSRVGTDQHGPWMEVAWTIDGVTQRVAFPITILNAWLRPEDVAPDPRDAAVEPWLSARAVRFDQAQDLTIDQQTQALANIGISGIRSITKTAGGFLELVDTDGNTFNIGLTAGAAPA